MSTRRLWHEITGMDVVDRDGRRIGRCADLVCQPGEGEAQLRVAGLLVTRGRSWRSWAGGRRPCLVPWPSVERVDDVIRLRTTGAEVWS